MFLGVEGQGGERALCFSGWNALESLDWDSLSTTNLSPDEVRVLRNLYSSGSSIPLKQRNNLDLQWATYTERNEQERVSPLIVQIAGNDPQKMSLAARLILQRTNRNVNPDDLDRYFGAVQGIDVNCGCPQSIARSGRYGAYLMEESLDNVCNILSQLRRDLPPHIGVSAKIRIPDGGSRSREAVDVLRNRIHRMIDAGYVNF